MEFISHRVNTIKELSRLPNDYGVEIDLRDYGENIVIQHDPFVSGEDFEKYFSHSLFEYQRQTGTSNFHLFLN